MKFSVCLTGLGMAGIKDELTIGLLLLTKLAAEFANEFKGRGECEEIAFEVAKGFEGGLKAAAEEPVKGFLLLVLVTNGSGGVLSNYF